MLSTFAFLAGVSGFVVATVKPLVFAGSLLPRLLSPDVAVTVRETTLGPQWWLSFSGASADTLTLHGEQVCTSLTAAVVGSRTPSRCMGSRFALHSQLQS